VPAALNPIFTQRDTLASTLITAINIIAGFLTGVFQHGMDLRRAIETYTVLTISISGA
jgi:flagellar biosynthesis protein FlhA